MAAPDRPDNDHVTPLFRPQMVRACATATRVLATLCAVAAYGVIYLAMNGDAPSLDMVLRHGPRLICELLHACSAQ